MVRNNYVCLALFTTRSHSPVNKTCTQDRLVQPFRWNTDLWQTQTDGHRAMSSTRASIASRGQKRHIRQSASLHALRAHGRRSNVASIVNLVWFRPTMVVVLSQWAPTFVEWSWQHVATIEVLSPNFYVQSFGQISRKKHLYFDDATYFVINTQRTMGRRERLCQLPDRSFQLFSAGLWQTDRQTDRHTDR